MSGGLWGEERRVRVRNNGDGSVSLNQQREELDRML